METNHILRLRALGTGKHFIEVCLDEAGFVRFMLLSGSRGVVNSIASMFIELAKQDGASCSTLREGRRDCLNHCLEFIGRPTSPTTWLSCMAVE